MMSKPGKQTVAKTYYPISQEVNAIRQYTKYGGETIHRPFSKKSK